MVKNITENDLLELGFLKSKSLRKTLKYIKRYRKREKKETIVEEAKVVLENPEQFIQHKIWSEIAQTLIEPQPSKFEELRKTMVPYTLFGEEEIDEASKSQLFDALKLPISVAAALMPDAHYGYGLPIGGVLATENSVIPYGVGVDIGCRMSLSVFDLPSEFLKGKIDKLEKILIEHTKFGMKEVHKIKSDHEIFERSEFRETLLLRGLLDKAYQQLGTSGGGNHFVEFGTVELKEIRPEWNLKPGKYLGLLSHSGSRGLGASIAKHYTELARKQNPLPKQIKNLAWLSLDTNDGQEYWRAMSLAGDYAKACHDDIHKRISKALGHQVALTIENHHNFAWKEIWKGKEVIVHRKGATPAAKGVLGVIPASMVAPGFIVEGMGNEESLNSASHGAGRLLSRSKCKQSFTQSDIRNVLNQHHVSLIGGNVDEAPMAYKDIHKVMSSQQNLVKVMGSFLPKVVRMDG